MSATATLLSKHVNFRTDGTAASISNGAPAWPVEWKKLVVNSIGKQPVSDADRLNGVSRRYHVGLSSETCRDWRPGTTGWSEWRQTGFFPFPAGIIVEEKNGVVSALGNADLLKFTPGPGPSIIEKQATGKKSDLPPGMTRTKK